jgi:hypothetical protein
LLKSIKLVVKDNAARVALAVKAVAAAAVVAVRMLLTILAAAAKN